MARIKFLLAFFALLVCAGGVVGAYFFWKKFAQPEINVTRRIEGGAEYQQARPDLGKRHFDAAAELLKEGELVSARDRLLYLMQYFPESATYTDAKRIVGEINMDLLLSKIPLPGKTTHTVSRGEALVTIARRAESTIDYIMRANAKTTALIYPDEELTVFPLKYRVEIDLEEEKVTVFDEDKFFKEYAILDVHLPPESEGAASTSISEKVAWHLDRPINFTDENYLNCSKWLRTGKIGVFIRQADTEKRGDARPYGVMVAKSDIEELFTIIRVGAKVNLVN